MAVSTKTRHPPNPQVRKRAAVHKSQRWGYLVPMPGVRYYVFSNRSKKVTKPPRRDSETK